MRRSSRISVGVLLPVPDNGLYLRSLREGLLAFGPEEASRLELEVRTANGTVSQFRQAGEELAARPVDILVTASTAAAIVLKTVTTTIPIVFVGTFDPVVAGLVSDLRRPGGNLTGVAGFNAEIAGDWIRHLCLIAPQTERVKILVNPASMTTAALEGWKAVMMKIVDVEELRIDQPGEIENAILQVSAEPGAGIVVVPHTFPFANRSVIVAAMANSRVPAIYGIAEMVRSGGLISFGQSLSAQWRMAGQYIVQIAQGASPAEMPVTYADQFELAINRGAASALGLTVPASLVARANELIG